MQAGSATTELQHLLSTPPSDFPGNANNSHAVAHAALQALRDSGDLRFLFLRTIFEIHQSNDKEELLFHCITGCRHVLLSKWTNFSPPFRQAVNNYFLALGGGGNNNNSSRTIRLAYYNASASFWKRQWNEENYTPSTQQPPSPEEQALLESISQQQQQLQIPPLHTKTDLFQYLDGIIAQPAQMASAASYLTTLVGEFAGKSASNYNMPLEFHKRAHASFEKESWLDQSLQMSMKALSQVVSMITTTTNSSSDHDNNNNNNNDVVPEDLAVAVVQVTIDVIGWEFGTGAWDGGFPSTSNVKSLVRPPLAWRDVLMQPEFIKAVFHVQSLVVHSRPTLGHGLRQLLLLLTSLQGPMFQNEEERKVFCSFLLEGIIGLLSTSMSAAAVESSELLDTLSMISKLIVNYKLSILVQLPLMANLHQGVGQLGRYLLQENLKECEAVQGDLESMEHREWREEAIALLLEGVVLLSDDPWLLYSGDEESRKAAQASLALTLGPLYQECVLCRTRMARLEEQYLCAHETELDEVREEIFAVDLEEEMTSLANVGRLDLSASLACLSSLFQQLVPQLQSLWEGNIGVVSPEAAGLLEESRLVTMYIGHLLTDDNSGESPVVPDSIIIACQNSQSVTNAIVSAVQTLQQFAQFQASKIAAHPSDPRLSPLLAKSFLWFLNRWAPAYILPIDYGASKMPSSILKVWSSTEKVQETVNFVITLCLHYHCYWPHEGQVQDNAAVLLLSLAKRCPQMRLAMVSSPSFRQLLSFHCLTSGIRHSAPPAEFEATVRNNVNANHLSLEMLRGYQRLPYDIKSKIMSALLVGCSEHDDEHSKALLNDCLKALHDAFSSLVHVLTTKQASPDSVDAKEMTFLCVELYGGVARASEMVASERIPKFLTPSLPHLSGLMEYYAKDLSICESLLRLFRDYAEQFIAVLDPDACLVLFQSSADLLKSYSSNHCASSRIIVHSAEEEQSYNDILCAIQLLIQLGTKDFIDVGDSGGVDSAQVTDMIFFGLQQILPLMTRGLLQFPTLCAQYFSLVGFMMETYPEKVGVLPFDLFDALFESLLFGMSHHDATVAKSSLQGLSGICREHLQSQVLGAHVLASSSSNNHGFLDKCSQRLLLEVVFQNIIWDRLEVAGMALLPLAAIDLSRFAAVVQGITQQIPAEHQQRLSIAFEGLLKPEVLSKVTSGGYEGRQNRIRFKKDFENFCHEIHSFLLMK